MITEHTYNSERLMNTIEFNIEGSNLRDLEIIIIIIIIIMMLGTDRVDMHTDTP